MSYNENPYYSPEAHGLTEVGQIDLSEPDYSFDILAVWHDERGFWLGTDSGCSCPSPFENYNGRDDMTGPLTAEQAVEEAKNLAEGAYIGYDYEKGESVYGIYDQAGLEKLIDRIEAADKSNPSYRDAKAGDIVLLTRGDERAEAMVVINYVTGVLGVMAGEGGSFVPLVTAEKVYGFTVTVKGLAR